MSFYTVRPEEQSVELTFGECRGDCIGEPGLNFAPWPVVTREIVQVTGERTEEIGSGTLRGATDGPDADRRREHRRHHLPDRLERARSGAVPVQPVRPDRDDPGGGGLGDARGRRRGRICRRSSAATAASSARRSQDLVQSTLDGYGSGVNIVRVNLAAGRSARAGDRRLPRGPGRAAGALDRCRTAPTPTPTRRLAAARGQSAQMLQEAESYRAQQVNSATGEASRFSAVLDGIPQGARTSRASGSISRRWRTVLGDVQMILVDTPDGGGQGVVPFLPLNELRRAPATGETAMNRRLPVLLGRPRRAIVVLLLTTIFIVDEREKAMVLQFGQVRPIKEEPGLGVQDPVHPERGLLRRPHPAASRPPRSRSRRSTTAG